MCPPGCNHDVSIIHGTGIYDHTSPICKSAMHVGVLDERGGFVTVKIAWPHKTYKGSTNMGITSMNLNWSAKSFTMS